MINGKTEGMITFAQSERALFTEWDIFPDARSERRNTEPHRPKVKIAETVCL